MLEEAGYLCYLLYDDILNLHRKKLVSIFEFNLLFSTFFLRQALTQR